MWVDKFLPHASGECVQGRGANPAERERHDCETHRLPVTGDMDVYRPPIVDRPSIHTHMTSGGEKGRQRLIALPSGNRWGEVVVPFFTSEKRHKIRLLLYGELACRSPIH